MRLDIPLGLAFDVSKLDKNIISKLNEINKKYFILKDNLLFKL